MTVHPSYLLRLPDEKAKAIAYAAFVEDLRIAHDALPVRVASDGTTAAADR